MRRFVFCICALTIILSLVSCVPFLIGITTLSIKVVEQQADLAPVAYDIWGTGPEGKYFYINSTQPTAQINFPLPGEWSITAEGRNSASEIISTGSIKTIVVTGKAQEADISAAGIAGAGSADLTVKWTAAEVASPVVQAELAAIGRDPIAFSFAMGESGSARCLQDAIPAGCYTLTVKLLDSATPVMGAVEIVRIVKDQAIGGVFDFSGMKSGQGGLSSQVTPKMPNPFSLTMSGAETVVGLAKAMSVTGTASPSIGSMTYAWYVNGEKKAAGSTCTINDATSALAAGAYRLDLWAMTADGRRGESASYTFHVTNKPPVVLEWDPNTETNLAGYTLYVGRASKAYDTSIDVGLVTTCSLSTLASGTTYYFSLVAYATDGGRSAYSNEVAYLVP